MKRNTVIVLLVAGAIVALVVFFSRKASAAPSVAFSPEVKRSLRNQLAAPIVVSERFEASREQLSKHLGGLKGARA
jgi:hypothetical protein